MSYTTRDAIRTLSGYLNIDLTTRSSISDTNDRGFVIELENGQRAVIFVYPISHKADDSKNFFDTRDSGARERGVAWNYAQEYNLKYFCLAVHDKVARFQNYVFSLECDERRIAEVSGTLNGTRNGSGTQVVIPQSCVPQKQFERIFTDNGFYISVIHKDHIMDYLREYDNRPYMKTDPIVQLSNVDKGKDSDKDNVIRNQIFFGAPGTGKSFHLNDLARKKFEANGKLYDVFTRDTTFEQKIKDELDKYKNVDGMDICQAEVNIGIKYSNYIQNWIKSTKQDDVNNFLGITGKSNYVIYAARAINSQLGVQYVERVTFHPNYSYAQFVGTYKPVQDEKDETLIKYKYVPGPFMRVLKNALKCPEKDFLLIIEEINRANVAAVFGDVFQLLDRDSNGESTYPIAASEDIKRYLRDNGINDCDELKIPSNMYIWATMNSADQGVFPMDTAFKRRWEFEYIGINDKETEVENYEIPMQVKTNEDGTKSHEWVNWNKLRTDINNKLTDMKINEDKLLGPFFISKDKLESVKDHNEKEAENFVKSFKSKVLMYLFEDVAKMRPGDLFDAQKVEKLRFSNIQSKFDEFGAGIFTF